MKSSHSIHDAKRNPVGAFGTPRARPAQAPRAGSEWLVICKRADVAGDLQQPDAEARLLVQARAWLDVSRR